MIFCEECGQRMTPDSRFCEACGVPIAAAIDTKIKAICSCIVVINSAAWRLRWKSASADRLKLDLDRYLNSRALQSGISYRVTDLAPLGACPKFENVIDMLREAAAAVQKGGSQLQYILLIGGGDDVPMAEYDFEHERDPDKSIASDHCYEVLSAERFGFSFTGDDLPSLDRLPIGKFIAGRIPLGEDTQPHHLVDYFKRAETAHINNTSHQKEFQTLGMCALVWQGASKQVANKGGIRRLVTSPETGPTHFKEIVESVQPDALYFNLHGTHESHASGYSGEFPRFEYFDALIPDNLSVIRKNYIAVSEACYGARFWHPRGAGAYKIGQSVMLSALYSKCLAFLGSSRVAYGSDSVPSLADITAMRFLESVTSNGHWSRMPISLGQSAYNARFAIPDSDDPAEQMLLIKNRLIFNLYGDPTLFHKPNLRWKDSEMQGAGLENLEKKPLGVGNAKDLRSELSSRMDSLRTELRSQISGRISMVSNQLRTEIQSRVSGAVHKKYPNLSSVNPSQSCYRNDIGESFLLSYKGTSPFEEVLVICTPDGKIKGTYEKK
jgi:hypothetical protein